MSQSKNTTTAKPLDVIVDAFPASVKHSDIAEVVTGRRNGNCTRALRGLLDDGLAKQLSDKSWKATTAGRRMVLGDKAETKAPKAKKATRKPASKPLKIDIAAGIRAASKRKAAKEAKSVEATPATKAGPSTVFGEPVCRVIRALAINTELSPKEIQEKIAREVDTPPKIATCRAQVGYARRGEKPAAELTPKQLKQLTR